jgi:hypothetical protein
MILRQFNSDGIEAFRQFLAKARMAPDTPLPAELLEKPEYLASIEPRIEVEPRSFVTRASASQYLCELLHALPGHEVERNAGLWTWLTLFFFDSVCPREKGVRDVKNDYTYIFEPTNSRHFYRHLLFISWRIPQIAPVHNRLFLSGSVASLDKPTSEVLKRLYLTRIPCIFEVLDRIYWDSRLNRVRPGMASPGRVRAGDLMHRFPSRLRQLEKTYDLFSLKANQLIELLGKEFQHE